jgi:hypothetical protein
VNNFFDQFFVKNNRKTLEMLGSTAFIYGEDSQLQRERTIQLSLEERKIYHPTTIFAVIYQFLLSNVVLTVIGLYLLWTAVGIVFYTVYDGWTPATAFYYAMEAGLSIGFCNPVEKDDWSKLFTIFYVLIGSTIISGSVGLIARTSILYTSPVIHVKRKDILRRAQVQFNISENLFYEGTEGQPTFVSNLRYFSYHFKYYIGWYSNRFYAIITVLLLIWFALGTLYCMLVEDWTFITSFYWSVTTYSTGGLQSANCEGDTGTSCNMGDMRGSVMGILMMAGVPIYALAMGQYARFFISQTIRYREQELLNRPIEDAEFLFAANILSPEGSETLVLGEYLLLELMRLGITNKTQIEIMKKKFNGLDVLNRGELDIDDLRREGKVVPNKREVMIDI